MVISSLPNFNLLSIKKSSFFNLTTDELLILLVIDKSLPLIISGKNVVLLELLSLSQ